jgi:hypothetical protein
MQHTRTNTSLIKPVAAPEGAALQLRQEKSKKTHTHHNFNDRHGADQAASIG